MKWESYFITMLLLLSIKWPCRHSLIQSRTKLYHFSTTSTFNENEVVEKPSQNLSNFTLITSTIRRNIPLSTVIRKVDPGIEFFPSPYRRGQYSCLCPFHADKNPSLRVDDVKGGYHCFACGAHGNNLAYIRGRLDLNLRQAVQWASEAFSIGPDGTLPELPSDVGESVNLQLRTWSPKQPKRGVPSGTGNGAESSAGRKTAASPSQSRAQIADEPELPWVDEATLLEIHALSADYFRRMLELVRISSAI